MLKDRRKCLRFDIPLDVKFKSKEVAGYSLGVTNNFSRKGFCFEMQKFDPKSKETIELKVRHPQEDTFISVTGDIVWRRQVEAKYLVGIKLREMHKEAKWEILDCCYNTWTDKMRRKNKKVKVAY